jgi:hypothetical protein
MSLRAGVLVDEAVAVAGRVILVRRVSGIPGAEGAPFESCVWRVVVLVVELGLPDGGAMRRDIMTVSGRTLNFERAIYE